MIVVYALAACFIAWIWIDYFRLIEIYGREDLKNIVIMFFLGAASSQVALFLEGYGHLDWIPLELNGNMANDFLYCILKIGLVEEFVKMIPFIIMYFVFRSAFKEPIDYVAFAAISALGFAAAENTMYFIHHHGEVIASRAILTSVGHMFYSALIGYGIVLVKYRNFKPAIRRFIVPGFAILAVLSHAFYDFWLINGRGTASAIISIFFFLYSVSWYATILNNVLNNSSTFSYKKTINSNKVMNRILLYYGIVIVIQFGVNAYEKDASRAAMYLLGTSRAFVFIIASVSARLSRFTLIQGRWQPIKIELPFRFSTGGGGMFGISVAVRGTPLADYSLNIYYEEYFMIFPVSSKALINTPKIAYIEKRLFIKNDESIHLAKIFKDDAKQEYDLYFLKPKTNGTVSYKDKYPIAALFRFKDLEGQDTTKLTSSDFGFIEWVYVKPLNSSAEK